MNADYVKAQITIPNIITFIRLLCIPYLCVEIYASGGYSKLGCVIFIAIWATDFIDGYLARRLNQVSDLGKVLDPLVDKILHVSSAIMMTIVKRVPLWVPIILAVKELIMIVASGILMKKKVILSAKWYGKVATLLLALGFVIVFLLPNKYIYLNSYIFIIPVLMSYFSLVSYAYQVYYAMKNNLIDKIEPNADGFRDLNTIFINN